MVKRFLAATAVIAVAGAALAQEVLIPATIQDETNMISVEEMIRQNHEWCVADTVARPCAKALRDTLVGDYIGYFNMTLDEALQVNGWDAELITETTIIPKGVAVKYIRPR